MLALKGNFIPLGTPLEGEWRYQFKEPAQSFADYIKGKVVRPEGKRKVIYIQPVGAMDSVHSRIVREAAAYLKIFFGLEVRIKDAMSAGTIPPSAKRVHDGSLQVLTQYIMFNMLKPALPEDAAAFIAFTTIDLYPEEGWNFVFGQASYKSRIGVWSLARFGDPSANERSFRLCLMRTFKTASHEMAHMFSMEHCVKYLCNMNGSLTLEESDVQPNWLCPECMCKLCWNLGISEREYCKKMGSFWESRAEMESKKYYRDLLAKF